MRLEPKGSGLQETARPNHELPGTEKLQLLNLKDLVKVLEKSQKRARGTSKGSKDVFQLLPYDENLFKQFTDYCLSKGINIKEVMALSETAYAAGIRPEEVGNFLEKTSRLMVLTHRFIEQREAGQKQTDKPVKIMKKTAGT